MTFAFALCADDFALSPAVTAGILEALAAGRLSATCAMTTQPGWPEAARAFRDLAPDADLGLHFNLTLGGPLSDMPRFAPSGRFPGMNSIVPAAWRRALPLDEIRDELRRQLDAFEDAHGAPPDFVDGHQHVQVLPGIAETLLAELSARGLAGACWLRNSADRPKRIFARGKHWGKALTVAGLARGFRNKARAAGFALNDGFSGFSDFEPGGRHFARISRAICWRRGRDSSSCAIPAMSMRSSRGSIPSPPRARRSWRFCCRRALPRLRRRRGRG